MPKLPRIDVRTCTALVTGAAGGMGEQLAHGLCRRGANVVLADKDLPALTTVAEALTRGYPASRIDLIGVDLSDRSDLHAMTQQVATEFPALNLLFNNAGVSLVGRFDEVSEREFEWLLEINLHAPIRIIRDLLPVLSRQEQAHIVNTSSIYGLVGPYGAAAYATSKFGLRGFSQSLGFELADSGIGVTYVLPGGVRTQIARNAHRADILDESEEIIEDKVSAYEKGLRFPADRAAEMIIGAVEQRRPRLLIGGDARYVDAAVRLAPGRYGRSLTNRQRKR